MASSLSSLVNNLAEGLHKGICKDCKSSLDCKSDIQEIRKQISVPGQRYQQMSMRDADYNHVKRLWEDF